jgi:glycosyltransferase involved in cell wall biosynthesis
MDFLFLNSKAHLLLMRSSTDVSGGAELQVALLSRELALRGFTTTIVHGSSSPENESIVDGVRCVPGGPFHTGAFVDVLRAIPTVFGAIRRSKPRHVLVLGWTAWLFLLWLARPIFRYRLVFICGLDTEADGSFAAANGVRGQIFDFAMKRCDVVFAMSDKQVELYSRRGITCELYRNLVLPRSAPRTVDKEIDLLWIARCREIKRPLAFLDLARAIPDARCVMACPPEDRALFERVKSEAAQIANVELHEFIPYHEVQNYYDRAKILVNTSIAEGFANSFIQAGQGDAAILSLSVDCDGVLERFDAGECAGDNPERLVEIAKRWLEPQSVDLARHQAGARKFVEQNHGTTENVNAFLDGLGMEPTP